MTKCVTGRRSPENCLPTDRAGFRAVLPFLQQRSILMLKLKLQYSGHLMQRADSLEKTLMLGKIKDKRRKW